MTVGLARRTSDAVQRRAACCTRPAPATDLRFHTQGTISRKEHFRALSDRLATSGTHACPTHNSGCQPGQSLACFCHLVQPMSETCDRHIRSYVGHIDARAVNDATTSYDTATHPTILDRLKLFVNLYEHRVMYNICLCESDVQ
jgi:hypothetical protein